MCHQLVVGIFNCSAHKQVAMSFAATLVLTAILSSASCQPSKLLSEERLTQESIFIGGITNNHIHQALFPDIQFVCPGNLSRWTVVATPVGGGTRYPELHVWRRNAATRTFTRFKRNKLSSDSPNPASRVYEAIRDPPLQFEAGDVLGVYNPTVPALSFRYQKQGGFVNYYVLGPITAYEEFDLDNILVLENRNDYPLVSVDVEPPECAVGFIERSALLVKASLLTVNSSDLEYRGGVQRIIPELSFPSDGEIVNVTLGALHAFRESRYPEIQVWRSVGSNQWIKVAGINSENATITFNIALNVHRYTPVMPVPVQAGDIVGMYQPSTFSSVLRVHMLGEGPVNYYREESSPLINMTASDPTERRLPLINFQFVPSEESQTGTIVAIVLVISILVLVLVVGGVVLLVYRANRLSRTTQNEGERRERSGHRYDVTVHVGRRSLQAEDTAPAAAAGQEMEYNEAYPQTDPAHVIVDGQKQAVDLKLNSAYAPYNAVNPATNQALYEDVDMD